MNFSIWTIFMISAMRWCSIWSKLQWQLYDGPTYGPEDVAHKLSPKWTQMILASDIELMEVELFRNCWIFFLKFSDFRPDIVYLVYQNHHLHLIITQRSFKSLFRKFNIINMIPLLHQICDISLITRCLSMNGRTFLCVGIVDWALSWFDRK